MSYICPPPPFLGLKTEEGNAVCVWMKLKLEAEWHCSGTGKSSQLPACVCALVMDGGAMRKGSAKTFPFGGPQQRSNKTSNTIPPKSSTHTHTDSYPLRDKHAARPTQTNGKQQVFCDHTRLCEFFCSRKKENYFTSKWLQSQLRASPLNSSNAWHKEMNLDHLSTTNFFPLWSLSGTTHWQNTAFDKSKAPPLTVIFMFYELLQIMQLTFLLETCKKTLLKWFKCSQILRTCINKKKVGLLQTQYES